jgi:Cytochrome P460
MSYRTSTIALGLVVGTGIAAAAFAQSAPEPDNGDPLTRSRQLPQYTASGDLRLPTNWRQWIFVGDPFTPNALNDGRANFPEYHNVYIEPGSYAIYKKTGVFPGGTIFVKELQLTPNPKKTRTARGQNLRGGAISRAISMAPM